MEIVFFPLNIKHDHDSCKHELNESFFLNHDCCLCVGLMFNLRSLPSREEDLENIFHRDGHISQRTHTYNRCKELAIAFKSQTTIYLKGLSMSFSYWWIILQFPRLKLNIVHKLLQWVYRFFSQFLRHPLQSVVRRAIRLFSVVPTWNGWKPPYSNTTSSSLNENAHCFLLSAMTNEILFKIRIWR